MKQELDIWSVVYKDTDKSPESLTYTSEEEALKTLAMIEGADGGEIIDEDGNVEGCVNLEWCYLISGKLIE